MAKNNPRRVPGLHGVCDDPGLPDEDEVIDLKLKPAHHFYYGKKWENCVNGVKREALSGRRPWERGYNTPPEADESYVEKYRIRVARENALKLLEDISEANELKKPSHDPVIGFLTDELHEKIAQSAMVPPPITDAHPSTKYHSQAIINRTDILTWTSQKGHTNQVSNLDGSQTDSNVAIAGNGLKTGQQGKRAAPLAWNFVKEGCEAKNPKIGPKDPKLPVELPGEKARYIPEDLDPRAAAALVSTITSQKCDVCSKSFMNNPSSRTSHYQSTGHLKKLNNWLKQKGYPLIELPKT